MRRRQHGTAGVALALVASCGGPGAPEADDAAGTAPGSDAADDGLTDGSDGSATATSGGPGPSSGPTGGDSGDGSSSGGDDGPPPGPHQPDCPEPDLDNLPNWVPAPGTWGTISLNTMWDLNPCDNDPNCSWSANLGQAAVLTAWNGGAFACHEGPLGSLIAWGGGHNGYWGNEIYVFDLDSQLWERRTDPYPDPIVTDPDHGEVADGTPSVLHTYELLTYHPATNAFVVLQGQPHHSQSIANGAGHFFSFDDDTWRRTAHLPNSSGYGNSAYDATRDLFWAADQYGSFWSWDPAGGPDAQGRYGTATNHVDVSISLDTVADIDPNNDVYVLLDFRADDRVLVADLTDPTSGFIQVAVTGPMPTLSAGGFEWMSEAQTFFWYSGTGEAVVTLEPPDTEGDGGLAGDWRTDAWRWESVLASAGSGPAPRGNGIYGGWRYAPSIQSFVIVNSVHDSVYAFRPEI